MSQAQPAQPERVTIDGKNYNLRPCTRCTGTVMIYLINKETDRNKQPIWDIHNKDGSAHDHNTKKTGGGFRPPAPKFSVEVAKVIGDTQIKLNVEYLKSDTTFDKAYEEVRAKLDEWAKKAVIQP